MGAIFGDLTGGQIKFTVLDNGEISTELTLKP